MICIDCTHAILRVTFNNLFEETFYSCELDGKQIVGVIRSCSRHVREDQPMLKEKYETELGPYLEGLKRVPPVEPPATETEAKKPFEDQPRERGRFVKKNRGT